MPLLNPNQQQAPQAPTEQQPQQQQAPMEQQGQGQGEEIDQQKAFDKFMVNALKILHTPETTDKILARISKNPESIDAVGETALDIVKRLQTSAVENNFPINANTVMNGLNVIIGEIIEIAEAAGVAEFDVEQKYQAFSWAVSNYIDQAVKTGLISKQELIQLGGQMANSPEGQTLIKAGQAAGLKGPQDQQQGPQGGE